MRMKGRNPKLTEGDIDLINRAVVERKRLRAEAYQLSNAKLAEKFEVHIRTIERYV